MPIQTCHNGPNRKHLGHGVPTKFPTTSAVTLAQRYYNSYLVKSESTRQSSITTAKSNAVLAREKHEKTVREYELKRESTPIPSIIDKPLIKATKRKPKVYSSSHFKNVEKTPVSIFGTTPLQSQKAEETFENTQSQQKELFLATTGATDYKQAISLREKAQEKNPYVGTANTVYYKGEKVGSSGVLIEKKLREKIVPDDDIFEELAKPTLPKQEIPTDVTIPKPEMEIKVEHSKSQIPTYEFPEQIIPLGNTPKHYDQWRYISTLLDMEPKMPSATDKLVNQYMQNNQKHIQNTKTVDEITGKDIGSAEIIKIPTLDAVRDYGVEFGLNLASLYQTAKGKLYNEAEITTQSKIEKIYDSTPHEQSLEAVLFDSAIQQSKNTPAIINPTSGTNSVIPKKQSTSIPTSSSYIKEKTQTWQGAEYLAATIGVSVLGAFVPFGRGKSVVQAAKPVLKTTPSSPNTLAYLLKATPPSADNVVQAAKKQSKLTTITLEDGSKVKLTNHNKVKPTAKIQETPMLDKLLGKPSRYVDTSVKINNKKLVDKSSQIKDTISDTISDSILNPVSKRTTRPLGKFVRKSKVSKKLNEHKLEQMLKDLVPEKTSKQSPSKTYDVTDSMKAPEINQDVFNDIVKKQSKEN